ncbi:CYTH and CHAD domain-containing protein [Nocardia arizonensis]|uniref:CYTH and CHAD domain-containing protein n=1 Tax=Nocardia arizonensis TaxID=1141647 RepID=UPI0006D26982|nr:CYTH and CHAD domain-containing protein [Nocardia arizonensis]
MEDLLERESKWEVDSAFHLPTLEDAVPNGRVERRTVELTTTYYDTVDLDLLAQNVTLRRREGADESGWQLKIPQSRGRLELSAPLTEKLPAELAELVAGIALGKELDARAVIRTVRERHLVLDADGERVVEVDDDRVQARRVDASVFTVVWREVEVELGRASESLPEPLAAAFVAAGARRSAYPSKLSRVLSPPSRRSGGDSSAEQAVYDYIRAQIDQIFTGDIELRRGLDPIHDTRVASRRLRSTLRVFGALFDAAVIEEVERELKWYACVLGEVRDCEVQRRRLADKIADLPPELVLGPVAGRIEAELLGRQVRRRTELAEAMNTARYSHLLTILRDWISAPPFARPIGGHDLVDSATRAAKKADKRLATALRTKSAESLHRARKAAKRARYAAELHGPARKRRRARANVAYYKKVQNVLGDYNDGMVSAEFLWRMATVAGTEPRENGFTYGLLYANEHHEAQAARERIADVVAHRK